MIDWIKLSVSNFDKFELIKNPLLNFIGDVNTDTGEIILTRFGTLIRVANYKSLKFTLKENKNGENTLHIRGSLHKYFNNGDHNFNDFTFKNLLGVLNDLEQKFGINLNDCVLHNIEIGVNITPPVPSNKVLKGLVSHFNKPFNRISIYNADFYQVMHSNFYIKAYDKAKQNRYKFNVIGEIFRFELKYIRMADLVNLLKNNRLINENCITLIDLKNVEILRAFGKQLLKVWNEILFYDYSISKKDLTKHQNNKLLQWSNINYWEDLLNQKNGKQKKYKQKKKLDEVFRNHSDQLQFQVSNLIQAKLSSLILKGLPFNQDHAREKGNVSTNIENRKGGPINSILIQLNGNQKQTVVSPEIIEVDIPIYSDWINDERELPF